MEKHNGTYCIILGYMGDIWKRKWKLRDYNGDVIGLHRDNGKEDGQCYIIIGSILGL